MASKEREEKVMACANGIADQFVTGFCNDRMVEFFADVIRNYIPEKPEPLSDEVVRKFADGDYFICNDAFIKGVRWAEKQHGIRSFDDE